MPKNILITGKAHIIQFPHNARFSTSNQNCVIYKCGNTYIPEVKVQRLKVRRPATHLSAGLLCF